VYSAGPARTPFGGTLLIGSLGFSNPVSVTTLMASMAQLIKLADLFTIGNLTCGMLAIFASAEGSTPLAAAFLFVALILDTFDGKVAGWMNQRSEFGKQLDSLADLVSFGVAPAYMYFAQAGRHWAELIILVAFVTCGMLRLARYNISHASGFEGVPITVNGFVFPALVSIGAILPETIKIWPWVFVVLSVLMVSNLDIKRLF
jgi:CDP-diacylglycerol--serine O-phosphatidyltransferase